MKITITLIIGLFLCLSVSWAESQPQKKRTELDFEGEVVEGIGRQSLDSLSQLSEGENQKELHLYEKQDDYSDRDQERINEIIETY